MDKEYKTINGELIIKRENNIVIAKFSGALDKKIALFYQQSLPELTKPLKGKHWGYLSVSQNVDAATPEAEDIMVQAVQLGISLGCVGSAFVLSTHLAIAQTDRMLKKAGLEQGITGKTFSTEAEARDYLKLQLANFHC